MRRGLFFSAGPIWTSLPWAPPPKNSAYGATKNPSDFFADVAGGSSGGRAAIVAMDGCWGALGSTPGGSIRQPASLRSGGTESVRWFCCPPPGLIAVASLL